MRAALVRAVGEEIEIRDDVEAPPPGPGEVRVKIAASGVCHSDLSCIDGTLPNPLPAVLGHEGAGEIVALGEGVTSHSVGEHVIIAWCAPCGACAWCLGGQPNLCNELIMAATGSARFSIGSDMLFGFAGTGTLAEELNVSASAAIKIPSDVPLDIASLIGCGVMTGVGAALNTAQVKPGSTVVVIGCGGVGISVIQGARIAGASAIVAVDLFESKLEMAKKFGATHTTTPANLVGLQNELTGGRGFDYGFEVIGLPDTIRQAYDATRRGGTTIVVGAGSMMAMVPFSAFELFYMEKTLKGCWYGSADVRTDFHKLLGYWREGKLDLENMISRRIDLKELPEAFEAMKKGEVIRSVVEF